jgi:hypothetical protein
MRDAMARDPWVQNGRARIMFLRGQLEQARFSAAMDMVFTNL